MSVLLWNQMSRQLKMRFGWQLLKLVRLTNRHRAKPPNSGKWPIRVLVDSQLIAHAIVCGSKWVETANVSKWGDETVQDGYLTRAERETPTTTNFDLQCELEALASLADLARENLITLCTCGSLNAEQLTQDQRRYRTDVFGLSLFDGVEFEFLPSPAHVGSDPLDLLMTSLGKGPKVERRKLRSDKLKRSLKRIEDPAFVKLTKIFQSKNADCFHIWVAEHNDCFCFLTLDQPLLKDAEQGRKDRRLEWLETEVMRPSHLARLLGVIGTPPTLVINAS